MVNLAEISSIIFGLRVIVVVLIRALWHLLNLNRSEDNKR